MFGATEEEMVSSYRPSSFDEINYLRGRAIHQYIHLETQAYSAFAFAVGARATGLIDALKDKFASEVYLDVIRNSHSHRRLLRSIGRQYLPDDKQIFVRPMLNAFEQATTIRNALAHRKTGQSLGLDGELRFYVCNAQSQPGEGALFAENLEDFIVKGQFLLFALTSFSSALLFCSSAVPA